MAARGLSLLYELDGMTVAISSAKHAKDLAARGADARRTRPAGRATTERGSLTNPLSCGYGFTIRARRLSCRAITPKEAE
jgi:hypothetical protein